MLNPLINRLGTETAFSVLARAEELKTEGKDIINLGIGQPDFIPPINIINKPSTQQRQPLEQILVQSPPDQPVFEQLQPLAHYPVAQH